MVKYYKTKIVPTFGKENVIRLHLIFCGINYMITKGQFIIYRLKIVIDNDG